MRLAETVRSRWVIALGSIALAGSLIAFALPCGRDAVAPKRATVVKPWTACRGMHKKPPVAKPHEVTGADYREALMAERPAFETCLWHEPAGVTYTVKAHLDERGKLSSVEVRGEHADLSKVNLHVVKCMEHTMSGVRFPATGEAAFVSTSFVTPEPPVVVSGEPTTIPY